jgi:hypothetical protein
MEKYTLMSVWNINMEQSGTTKLCAYLNELQGIQIWRENTRKCCGWIERKFVLEWLDTQVYRWTKHLQPLLAHGDLVFRWTAFRMYMTLIDSFDFHRFPLQTMLVPVKWFWHFWCRTGNSNYSNMTASTKPPAARV